MSGRPLRSIFAWPLFLGLASLGGLILGLTGDGLRDALAWLLLGTGPAAIVLAWVLRAR